MTDLVTLSGNYNYHFPNSRRYNRRLNVNARNEELVDGLLDYVKSAGTFIAKPFISVGKGTGHFAMEAYRGVKTGDIGRVLKSPFKGAGHAAFSYGRAFKEHAEYYWRPSKMKDWMKPIGGSLMAIAPFTGPAAIVLFPLGAVLTLAGAAAETIYINDQIKKAEAAAQVQALEDKKKANYIWYGAAAIGAVGLYMVFT